MDPDANLKEQRELVRDIRRYIENEGRAPTDDTDRLVDLVEALDEWIVKGGFLPRDWRQWERRRDLTKD
jgi:hypothetical protein